MSNSFTNSNSAHKFKWISWTQCKFKVQITLIIFRKLWKGCQLPSTYPPLPLPSLYLHTVYACVCVCECKSKDTWRQLCPSPARLHRQTDLIILAQPRAKDKCNRVLSSGSALSPPPCSLQKLLPWKRGRGGISFIWVSPQRISLQFKLH